MPTVFTPAAPAMPAATVQKITGAMIIRTSLMKRVAERLHRGARLRPQMSDEDAHRGGNEHLPVERLVEAQAGHVGTLQVVRETAQRAN